MESVKIFFSWINVFKNTFFSISTPENVYLDKKIFDTYSDLVRPFVEWPPLESVKLLLFCWNNVFRNTLFFISTPENVYLDKNISILGGLEAEILTRVVCGLCRPFLKWPPLKSNIFFDS